MKQILINVLTFSEFKEQLDDKFDGYLRFDGRRVNIENGAYYIKDDLIEWEMLKTDLLLMLPHDNIATIDGDGVEFYTH